MQNTTRDTSTLLTNIVRRGGTVTRATRRMPSARSASVCVPFSHPPPLQFPNSHCFFPGPRACIGRKFATTEAVCFLTLLLRDFIIIPVMRSGETKEAWQNRVLDARFALTLGVADVPVKFVRRDKKTV
jgi:cytochrome P450